MHHTKLILFALVLVVVIIFGFIFWGDLLSNQQEISNTPLPVEPEPALNVVPDGQSASSMSGSDDVADIESDLNATLLELDEENAEMEAELGAL